MDIMKIKFDGKKVYIEYEVVKKDEEADYFIIQSTDQPLESFKQALQSLKVEICQKLDWPDEWSTNISVRGVSISYSGEKRTRGIVITAMKMLKSTNRPFNFNTPYIPETGLTKNDPHLSPIGVKGINRLIDEAKKYFNGERAQGEMFEKTSRESFFTSSRDN